MKYYLLVDFGSTYTKLTLVDLELKSIIKTSKALTTVNTNIADGYNEAVNKLYDDLDKKVKFDKIVACSSANGGLKMAAIGLVEELTTEAAKRVCLGAGAKVELVLSHNINNQEVNSIIDHKIDIILLAGGANGGNKECVIHNAKKLADSNIKAPIVYAGNKDAIDQISEILSKSNKEFYICENVMPKINILNIESAKNKIKEIFVENIIDAKGIKKIEEEIDQVILPTPNAVLIACELLSKGYLNEKGLGDLMLADIGGATTDIYSMSNGLPTQMNAVLSGLEEPFAKRTVEGDLGMRYSSLGILQSYSNSELNDYLNNQIDISSETKKRHDNIEFLPLTNFDFEVEDILASKCIDVSIERHVGTLKSYYTPMGIMYHQVGKDLTNINYFIGTGGVVINSKNPVNILRKALKNPLKPLELRPINPIFLLDKDYILSAMGLLSIEFPEIALKIMKEKMIKI